MVTRSHRILKKGGGSCWQKGEPPVEEKGDLLLTKENLRWIKIVETLVAFCQQDHCQAVDANDAQVKELKIAHDMQVKELKIELEELCRKLLLDAKKKD